jgi:hypothetical protein
MPLVHVDVSVFSSAVTALGNATGELLLDTIPDSGTEFPWPPHLKAMHPSYFTGANAVIDSASALDIHGAPRFSVRLVGIVCSSERDARCCAVALESIGLSLYEYPRAEA